MNSPTVRGAMQPFNHPAMHIAEARLASTDAFHVAMLVAAGMLVAGAIVNAVGLRSPAARAVPEPATPETLSPQP
jgi:hypothetical protein